MIHMPHRKPLALVSRLSFLFCAMAALAQSAWADVLVVRGPGATHFALQSAVDAAADGDVILVRAGTDPALSIQGKSLSIVVEPLANALVLGVVTIEQLSSAQCVVITGLKVQPVQAVPTAVSIQNCLGHVRLNQCTIYGSSGNWQTPWPLSFGGTGLQIGGSLDVALAHCTIQGGPGSGCDCDFGFTTPGGAALETLGSRVAITSCTLLGGVGGSVYDEEDECSKDGSRGGDGLRTDAVLFAAGTTIRGGGGGTGGDGDFLSPGGNGGDGGHGLVLAGATHVSVLLDNTLAGGLGGPAGWFGMHNGLPGQPLVGSGAVQLPGRARKSKLNGVVREQQLLGTTFQGLPGDQVWLLGAPTARFYLSLAYNGVFLAKLSPFLTFVPLGTIPASGTLTVQRGVGELGAGINDRLTHTQALFVDAGGVPWLADAQPLVVLDSSY